MADGADPPRPDPPLVELRAVMARLRAECGWKAAQTHRSLARYLLEETHETLEAIETGDADDLRDELGDLLLQVYFHAAIAEEAGDFDLDDVARGLLAKLLRRNPHVFGPDDASAGVGEPDVRPSTPEAVNELWEAVKATERQRASVLDGIPATLPALLMADKVLDRLARAGTPARLGPPYLLLPSPFLPPSSLEPLAAWLRGRGRPAAVAAYGELDGVGDDVDLAEVVVTAARAATAGTPGPVALVTHSGSGHYAPLLATRIAVAATVHLDAAMPGAERPSPVVPAALRGALVDLAGPDGRLPGWSRWWSPEDLAALAPPDVLAGLAAEEPRVPASYADATIEVPDGWTDVPAAYVALGDTYAEERAAAAAYGWPVRTLPGGHLLPLVDPATVGTAVLRLTDELLDPAPGDHGDPAAPLALRLLRDVADARAHHVDPEQILRLLLRSLTSP